MATSLLTENKLHLEDLGVLGHGTFGTVRKARYKNELVAVKIFDRRSPHVNETEFHKDLNQLKRFSHPNIIRIITHGKYNLHNSIVMEYADVGSLDTVLHEKHNLNYTINHAVSWLYQTANGVHYLHTHNTKPIAHRDLKPMNLLLMKGGTVLKLCDFGTACELHSLMTCERGTTLYMAPEVLSSKDYNERCDIYSFGIILWEVLTRKKPYFDQPNLGSFRIMFMVKEKALRPTQISKCPSLLKTIYDRCVDAIPEKRPSMDHLLKIFGKLNELTNRNPVRPIVEPETPKVLRAADLKPFTTSNESLLSQVSTCSTVLGKTVKKIENTGSTDTDFVLINDVSDDDTELMRDIKFRLSFHNNANQKTNKLDQATIKGHRRSRSYGNAEVSINFNNNNTNNSNININNNNSSNQLNNNLCVNFVNDSKYAAGNNNNNNNNLPTGASKAPPNRFFSESNTPISPNNPINQLNLLNPSALNEFDFNSTQLIEPILDSPQSIKLYNEHCHCMQLSSKLDEEFTQLHKQKEQLEKQIRNQDVFFDLQKQKQVLETENSKLAAKLLNSNY